MLKQKNVTEKTLKAWHLNCVLPTLGKDILDAPYKTSFNLFCWQQILLQIMICPCCCCLCALYFAHIFFLCCFQKTFLRKEFDWKKFQSEFILNSCLNVKEILARSRREIWSLSHCNWTQTHIHLVRKRSVDNPQPLSSLTFGQLYSADSLW